MPVVPDDAKLLSPHLLVRLPSINRVTTSPFNGFPPGFVITALPFHAVTLPLLRARNSPAWRYVSSARRSVMVQRKYLYVTSLGQFIGVTDGVTVTVGVIVGVILTLGVTLTLGVLLGVIDGVLLGVTLGVGLGICAPLSNSK